VAAGTASSHVLSCMHTSKEHQQQRSSATAGSQGRGGQRTDEGEPGQGRQSEQGRGRTEKGEEEASTHRPGSFHGTSPVSPGLGLRLLPRVQAQPRPGAAPHLQQRPQGQPGTAPGQGALPVHPRLCPSREGGLPQGGVGPRNQAPGRRREEKTGEVGRGGSRRRRGRRRGEGRTLARVMGTTQRMVAVSSAAAAAAKGVHPFPFSTQSPSASRKGQEREQRHRG